MRKSLIIIMLLLPLLLSAQRSERDGRRDRDRSGRDGSRGRGGRSWWNNSDLLEALKVTEDQKEKLKKLSKETEKANIDLRADLEDVETKLKVEMREESPD